MTHSKTLLLGIGNTLLTDEGAGVHALNLFQLYHPDTPNITCIDGGTLSFTLATYIEECTSLIVFDAAELHAPAGRVECFVGREMDAFLAKGSRSPHEVGLLDLMDIARLTGSLPANRALIGIQPGSMDWGMAPTDEVQDALAYAVRAAEDLLAAWERQTSLEQGRAVA
jgi:hydrogenase maturation protease